VNNALRKVSGALESPNVRAFLRMIRAGETSQTDDAYRMMFGGELVADMTDHPRRAIRKSLGGKLITSTAAGAYQFLYRTWAECASALALPDFSPASQDASAVYLIDRRGALPDVLAGKPVDAIRKCAREWASLPGSPYGQPVKTMAQALAVYAEYGGAYSAGTIAQPGAQIHAEKTTMPLPAFALALLPALFDAVPKLVKRFGDGSSVPERNVAAIEAAIAVAKDAIGAKTEQELADALRNEPVSAQAVRIAIEENWGQINDVGGGIEAAREANAAQATTDPRRNLALWVTTAILPLVYLTVYAVLFREGWSSEVRAMVVAAIVSGLLSSMTGYWLGTSFSSAKKDDRAHERATHE